MDKLIFASSNKHKIEETRALLPNIEIIPYTDLLGDQDIEETGNTFAENAAIKAEFIASQTGLPTISDDSGLCIPALDGFPGIFSARFAAQCGGYPQAYAELQERLGDKNPAAYFISVIALTIPAQPTQFFEGRVNAHLTFPPRGNTGFGYDPIMIPDGYDKSFAELGDNVKNAISHRARAIAKLKEHLCAKE